MTQGVLWPEPNRVEPSVWVDFDDVQRALDNLGVPLGVLMRALQVGRASLNSRTPYDAPTAPGYYQWNECVRSLSEQLVPQGWTRTNSSNQPLLTHPQRRLVIIVNSGNRNVGDPEMSPTTKFPKKRNHRQMINSNARQLEMFPCPVWFLLYSAESGELRSELSLPMGMSRSGYIGRWIERIVLPRFPGDSDLDLVIPEPDYGPDIEIDIQRRA